MSDQEIVPISELQVNGINLSDAILQGQSMIEDLKSKGVREATFDNGAYFNHNSSTATTTLAADGIILEQRQHTTTIVLRNDASNQLEALAEVREIATQKTLGAFSGHSQPWISQKLGESNEDQ
ncbi:hypothetical protein [Pseudomonas brassicacearum]|uniref:Uncharacterized protein n=1 Tax=Pseudomonas brassicacearum TaxID=930166 RepID=A0A423GV08_9PSED|nr:hypothetical protein [Pseudomonas brassicacearum]RON01307.1 hypothetical protein BK658_09085 [Pseudomonas brassicacearum]